MDFLKFALSFGWALALMGCQYIQPIEPATAAERQEIYLAAGYQVQLGLAYLQQGDTPRAKQKLLKAYRLAPKSADVNAALAFYLERTKDIPNARVFYNKALSLAPTSGSVLNHYGAFLCRSGHYKEADAYFLKAVKDLNYINSAGAYENAGLCAAEVPDEAKALYYFNKALAQDPNRKQALAMAAKIEMKSGHADKALRLLQQYHPLVINDTVLLALEADAAHQAGFLG